MTPYDPKSLTANDYQRTKLQADIAYYIDTPVSSFAY
jgi:hypothetical protein